MIFGDFHHKENVLVYQMPDHAMNHEQEGAF